MGLHFLIADDNDDSRNTVIEYLKSLNFSHFTEAANGAEAIKKLDIDSSIGFLISDWDMPIINGPTLVRNIRSDPRRQSLPILITTAPIDDEKDKVALAIKYKVDGYLLKPFRREALQEKLAAVFSARGIKEPV